MNAGIAHAEPGEWNLIAHIEQSQIIFSDKRKAGRIAEPVVRNIDASGGERFADVRLIQVARENMLAHMAKRDSVRVERSAIENLVLMRVVSGDAGECVRRQSLIPASEELRQAVGSRR